MEPIEGMTSHSRRTPDAGRRTPDAGRRTPDARTRTRTQVADAVLIKEGTPHHVGGQTDPALIDECASWLPLLQRCSKRCPRHAREDVVATANLLLWQHLRAGGVVHSLPGLAAALIKTAVRRHQHWRKRLVFDGVEHAVAPTSLPPFAVDVRTVSPTVVAQITASLPGFRQRWFVQRLLEGASRHDMAAGMGCSAKEVSRQLHELVPKVQAIVARLRVDARQFSDQGIFGRVPTMETLVPVTTTR